MIPKGKKRGEARHKRGLTLLELLITTLVFSLAIGGVLTTFHYCLLLSRLSQEQSVALYHAKNIMEKISATPFNNITADFPDNVADGGGVNDYTVIAGGYTLRNEQIIVNYTNPLSDPLEIIVTVSWAGHQNRQHSLNLSTLKTE